MTTVVTIWALRLGLMLLPLTCGVLAAESVATGGAMHRTARVWWYIARGCAAVSAACLATAAVLYVLG